MFGYITPLKPEMRMREYELYRGYYCGVCKEIGKRFGQIPRLTLNYDSVFLAMVFDAVDEQNPLAKHERCFLHPVQKRLMVKNSPGAAYAADIHILLSYYKCRDDFSDERRAGGFLGMSALYLCMKKMMKKYPRTCIIIQEKLAALTELEKNNCPSLDKVSEPFAGLMEAVFSPENTIQKTSENNAGALRRLGYHLGKWLYITDAWDDREKNRAAGAYNPFLEAERREAERPECGSDAKSARSEDTAQTKPAGSEPRQTGEIPPGPDLKQRAEFSLMYHLGEMAGIAKMLPLYRHRQIIENILYLGMLKKTEEVLGIKGEGNDEESI